MLKLIVVLTITSLLSGCFVIDPTYRRSYSKPIYIERVYKQKYHDHRRGY